MRKRKSNWRPAVSVRINKLKSPPKRKYLPGQLVFGFMTKKVATKGNANR